MVRGLSDDVRVVSFPLLSILISVHCTQCYLPLRWVKYCMGMSDDSYGGLQYVTSRVKLFLQFIAHLRVHPSTLLEE